MTYDQTVGNAVCAYTYMYLFVKSWAIQCMTWGNAVCIIRHLGIFSMASVRLGERPNLMFVTSTFSKDCKIGG